MNLDSKEEEAFRMSMQYYEDWGKDYYKEHNFNGPEVVNQEYQRVVGRKPYVVIDGIEYPVTTVENSGNFKQLIHINYTNPYKLKYEKIADNYYTSKVSAIQARTFRYDGYTPTLEQMYKAGHIDADTYNYCKEKENKNRKVTISGNEYDEYLKWKNQRK